MSESRVPKCPHCGEPVAINASMAAGTILTMTFKTQPGQMFSVREVGGLLDNFGKAIEAVGDNVTGDRSTVVLLHALRVNEDTTEISADALVTMGTRRKRKRKKPPASGPASP